MKIPILRLGLLAGLLLSGGISSHAQAPVPTPTYTRTIYLIRHGAYDMSEQKGDETTAYGLTPLGIAEARLVATRLRGLPVDFTSLISSTLTRARQTADVINQSLPQLKHETDPLLVECRPRTEDDTSAQPNEDEKQLDQAFAKYFVPGTAPGQCDILVCHGNVIRYLVMKALGVETQAWPNFNVAHCSMTVIQVNAQGRCSVMAVGDTGHIPPNMVSGQSRSDPQLVVP
jgi:serine/threonine-protein phosphatase PGAM5